MGKLKTLSLRDTFGIFKGDSNEILYKVTADLFSRILTFRNTDGEQIAVMAKTKKALIKEAVLGSGLESTIDIARGVDISVILASIFGIMAVGNSCTCFHFRILQLSF